MPIRTAFTKSLARLPIVLPPMAGVVGGALASAAHKAGAFALLAGGHSPLPALKKEIELARTTLSLSPTEPLPIGIGLIVWRLESPHGDPSLVDAYLDLLEKEQPAAVWLSFSDDLGGWVKKVRARLPNKQIWVMVYDAKTAVQAATEWGVDAVVIQGSESGGHGSNAGSPLFSLLPEVKGDFAKLGGKAPLLLAAGGITTGAQLAASLAFADAAVMGTTFLSSPESMYSQAQKEHIINSTGEQTYRTQIFDELRGTMGFGPRCDGRAIANATTMEWPRNGEVNESGIKRYDQAVKEKDVSRVVTWAGTSVSLVKDAKPAAEKIEDIIKEAEATLSHLGTLVSSA